MNRTISAAEICSPHSKTESGSLSSLLARRALRAHFQPIVDLHTGGVIGHESLIRGPADSALALPDALFAAARSADLVVALEFECVRVALQAWAHCRAPGKLFVNLSASALAAAVGGGRLGGCMEFLGCYGISASALVIEITEHERVTDIHHLHGVIDLLRLHGAQLALDDFGDGRSSLRLWSELKPDYVKIDRYFSLGVADNADKLQTFRTMLQIAETFGAELVAEGVERPADLRVLRDLGVDYGQGWLLARPEPEPASEPSAAALEVLRCRSIAVLPERRVAASRRIVAGQLLVPAPTVEPTTTNDELFQLITSKEELHAVAVALAGEPLALIDCQHFVNRYARPFFKELYGRRSCMTFANRAPLLVEFDTAMEQLTGLLTAGDQCYLREGFIITEQGRYRGLGTGQALVKAVTEARIEAARYANPLTLLPGNIPISQHIKRVLASGAQFVAAHADLNHFKPFNDRYGYWRGDEMIMLAAGVIVSNADATRDFTGHIGGDDFIVVFQSGDWAERCDRIVSEFNYRALALLDPQACAEGGIRSEDRHGNMCLHPCTSMSIGIVVAAVGQYRSAEDVSAAAAAARRQAKQASSGCHVLNSQTSGPITKVP